MYLKIYTTEGKYELWFEPYKARSTRSLVKQIAIALGIIEGKKEGEIKVKPLQNISCGNLVLSIIFLGYGLFNVIAFMTIIAFFQTFIAYILIIMGSYVLSNELRKLPIPQEGNSIRYDITSKYYQEFVYAKKIQNKSLMFCHIKFEVFWSLTMGAFLLFVTFTIVQMWMVLNQDNIRLILIDTILMTIIGAGLAFLLILHALAPRKYLLVKAESYEFGAPMLRINSRRRFTLKENIREFTGCAQKQFF